MSPINWNKLASGIIKAELKRRDITYEQLIILLKKIDVEETQGSIVNKLSRGTFSFSFALQVLQAIGVKTIRLNEDN